MCVCVCECVCACVRVCGSVRAWKCWSIWGWELRYLCRRFGAHASVLQLSCLFHLSAEDGGNNSDSIAFLSVPWIQTSKFILLRLVSCRFMSLNLCTGDSTQHRSSSPWSSCVQRNRLGSEVGPGLWSLGWGKAPGVFSQTTCDKSAVVDLLFYRRCKWPPHWRPGSFVFTVECSCFCASSSRRTTRRCDFPLCLHVVGGACLH